MASGFMVSPAQGKKPGHPLKGTGQMHRVEPVQETGRILRAEHGRQLGSGGGETRDLTLQ